jgi:hypothetical protein
VFDWLFLFFSHFVCFTSPMQARLEPGIEGDDVCVVDAPTITQHSADACESPTNAGEALRMPFRHVRMTASMEAEEGVLAHADIVDSLVQHVISADASVFALMSSTPDDVAAEVERAAREPGALGDLDGGVSAITVEVTIELYVRVAVPVPQQHSLSQREARCSAALTMAGDGATVSANGNVENDDVTAARGGKWRRVSRDQDDYVASTMVVKGDGAVQLMLHAQARRVDANPVAIFATHTPNVFRTSNPTMSSSSAPNPALSASSASDHTMSAPAPRVSDTTVSSSSVPNPCVAQHERMVCADVSGGLERSPIPAYDHRGGPMTKTRSRHDERLPTDIDVPTNDFTYV